jgi:mRNA interferase RelE/StbE
LAWTIDYTDDAARKVRKLGRPEAKRILDYMDYRIAPSDDPRQFGKALVGDLSGYWRYRVGDYRIVCQLIEQRLVVLVVDIGHRSDVYR